ncbi:MAG: hypothetical protein U5M51_02460 [Emticicia sp.]|nr:hypothetical protein [Emticicia sp.]
MKHSLRIVLALVALVGWSFSYAKGSGEDPTKTTYLQTRGLLTAYSQKILTNIGDLDAGTANAMIEVKAGFGSVKEDQLGKFLNSDHPSFCNPFNKKIILYIDEPLSNANQAQINMINRIKAQRGKNGESITVVYTLTELIANL